MSSRNPPLGGQFADGGAVGFPATKFRRSRSGDAVTPEAVADEFLLAEARARVRLLLICSRVIDANPLEVGHFLPADPDAKATMLGTLHQLRRRLEVDRSLIEAALARWTLESDDFPGGYSELQ